MKHLLPTAVSSFVGMTAGNFIFQLMTNAPEWGVATERSFFQFVAIALFVGLMAPKMRRLRSN
ncbi:hypothetical protein A3H77_02515 [Candidatus Kaiserbacteria bacterium RIFCSPLOWO2_02_FULL_56_11]|uniref:Uncharacterized protein n=2 Tax=Candidatus Kaiseribacteriota TaxID=1752734 RepID=A0A1F6E3X5_9BACT|nr:MAG: hypothetical protein A3C95_01725 [Candidatus Kaiserbacteria bacterium RIFCSPHIGHO2_02_FULL_56_30]OGG72119.1 MAG: hypothetical protein A3E65_00815 [Candidatus Kaiserbacteria bacterium RIFCSPHIGHO2_12_FULL_56_13]OGG82081.1 MAG: hypothetical protein A3H77_02515 [Candidatus Kaiserbacteria bacterium RIFCSPLOWO2_02_FULL_56_11]